MKALIGKDGKKFLTEKMFGLFFEDINYAGDGGLYAEMLENRQFAFRRAGFGDKEKTYVTTYAGEYGWDKYPADCSGEMSFKEGNALTQQNPHYMQFEVKDGKGGFTNKAYDGICMKTGEKYCLTIWVRSTAYNGTLQVKALDAKAEKEVASACIMVTAEGEWKKYEAQLCAETDVKDGIFLIEQEKGCLDYGYISLIPANAVEGIFRKDLFDMLMQLRPGFLRFPGGCIVEGANLNNRYQWKDTVGEPWEKKWNWNRWAVHDVTMGQGEPFFFPVYNQSYGIGFYEYFLLSELLGAKALPVLSVGLACQFQSDELVPIDTPEFQEYLQDALDLVEFANGDVSTKWGSVRAKMGHPAPFHLEYIGIGNEQWETEKVDFFARYAAFEKAIHEVYPDIKLIGSAGPDVTTEKYTKAWDFYKKECAKNSAFTHAVDEHYYMPPQWFYENIHMYDEVPRDIPVFAGEYAAHGEGKHNNWEAALAEAAFMCGLEKNGDVIRFASAAPLFARKGYVQWIPDYIWFDGDTVMGTPGYYVQQLFGVYTGSSALDYELQDANEKIYSAVSQDEKQIFVKVVNAGDKAEVLQELMVEGKKIDLKTAKIMQMDAGELKTENVLGGDSPIVLQQVESSDYVAIPGYSCTVVVIDK